MKIIQSKLVAVINLIEALQHFFKYLGLKKGATLAGGATLFALLSMLNVVAFLPAITFLSNGKEGQLFSYFTKIFGSVLVSSNIEASYVFISSAIAISFICKFIFGIIFSYLAGIFSEGYMNDLRESLIGYSVKANTERETVNTNEQVHFLIIISRIGSLNWAFINFIIRLCFAFAVLFIILRIDYRGLVAIVFFSIIWAFVLMPTLKKTREYSDRYLKTLKKVNHKVLEEISAYQVFLIFRKGKLREQMRLKKQEELSKNNAATSSYKQAVASSQELLIALVIAGLIYISPGYEVGIEEVLSIGFLISRLSNSFNEAITYYSNAVEMLPAFIEFKHISELGLTDYIDQNWGSDKSINQDELTVRLRGFVPEVLNIAPVELDLMAGDKVKVCGVNGVGKSTFLQSVLGYYSFRGSLLINNTSIDLNGKYVYKNNLMSYVSQDPILLEGSVSENIFSTEEEIKKLEVSLGLKLEDVIPRWRQLYIAEHGSSLSGGQKQLISIFRALAQNHKIIIMDEFTNHLSVQVKEKLMDFFNNNYNDKILIYVSHDNTVSFKGQKELWIS